MKTLITTAAVLAAALFLYLVVVWAATGSIRPAFYHDATRDTTDEIWRSLLLYLTMVIGVLAGNVYAGLSGRKTFGSEGVWATLWKLSFTPSLIRALVGSPIVFGVVYGMARGQCDIVLACVFSFENGFFCHLILRHREESLDAQLQKTHAVTTPVSADRSKRDSGAIKGDSEGGPKQSARPERPTQR
jgi:hypothetical protein